VTVRNPIERLPSLHLRFLYTLDEDEPDFAKAWRLQAGRARGECVPRTCRDPRFLQDAEVGRLAERVERLWEIAGPERRRFRSLALHRLLQRPPPLVARPVLRARLKREKGADSPSAP